MPLKANIIRGISGGEAPRLNFPVGWLSSRAADRKAREPENGSFILR